MSTDIERLLAEEAADSESNPDAPFAAGSTISRPNRVRSTVYSVRLNPEEVAAVQALAEAAGLPASTLVRSWITDQTAYQQTESQVQHEQSGQRCRRGQAERKVTKLCKV